jgi:predicted DNA-binding transcriptional regulator YafY
VAYWKAEQLLALATLVAARHAGVTLDDVIERFTISKRTAQRMLRAMETQFTDTTTLIDEEGRKRWRLPSGALRDLMSLSAEELAALDMSVETMKRAGLSVEAGDLLNLREKILALVPRSKAARIETDHEALLVAQGLAARPGPRQRIDRKIIVAIGEAIKACRMLDVGYRSRDENAPRRRRLAPYGLLTGLRRYLVARAGDDPCSAPLRLYVVENISSAEVANETFERDAGFNLQAFADRAFGVFQNEDEFGEVVWRFTPKAAAHARGFEFHPAQVFEEEPDGSLIVRFSAAGHLEMAWHLYIWGDQVDVLAPERLRQMIKGHRRADFPSLP